MVIKTFFKTRADGVDLYKSFDVVADENGNLVKDENGDYIPTGLMIREVVTNKLYASAIDIDGAPFKYEETDTPIPERKASAR